LQTDEDDESMNTGDNGDFTMGNADDDCDIDDAQGDGIGEFISDLVGVVASPNIELSSQSLSQVTRHAVPKTKKLTSLKKYNIILNEGRVLASIVSAEKSKLFSKAKNILKSVRTNIQNMGGDELKPATPDYLGIKTPALESPDTYGEMNDGDILASVLKRTSGATGMKCEKSSVETATTSSMGHACSLCHNKGHKRNKCPVGARIGVGLTEKTWSDKMALVPFIATIDQSQIDPVIPIDARAL